MFSLENKETDKNTVNLNIQNCRELWKHFEKCIN